MSHRAPGTPRLLTSALAGSTLPLVVLGSTALAVPAAADTAGAGLPPSIAASTPVQPLSSVPTSAAVSPLSARGPRTYTVRHGDTLSHIAVRTGVSLSTLMNANDLSRDAVIRPGQKITLSGSGSSSSSTSPGGSSTTTYTIQRGDTLSGIAARHGIGLSTLLTANDLSRTSAIHPGQQITVSGSSGSSSSGQLVPSTFLHYSYPSDVVASANENKRTLLDSPVPSRAQMRTIIADTARSMGVDPSLALAHAMAESSLNHTSVSPANAIGAMQIIPESGDWASLLVGRQLNLLDPRDNATAGVAIIRQHQRTSSSQDLGIAAYYQGAAGVQRDGMYPDTRDYVAKVKRYMSRF